MPVVFLRHIKPEDQLLWILSFGIWNDDSTWVDSAVWED